MRSTHAVGLGALAVAMSACADRPVPTETAGAARPSLSVATTPASVSSGRIDVALFRNRNPVLAVLTSAPSDTLAREAGYAPGAAIVDPADLTVAAGAGDLLDIGAVNGSALFAGNVNQYGVNGEAPGANRAWVNGQEALVISLGEGITSGASARKAFAVRVALRGSAGANARVELLDGATVVATRTQVVSDTRTTFTFDADGAPFTAVRISAVGTTDRVAVAGNVDLGNQFVRFTLARTDNVSFSTSAPLTSGLRALVVTNSEAPGVPQQSNVVENFVFRLVFPETAPQYVAFISAGSAAGDFAGSSGGTRMRLGIGNAAVVPGRNADVINAGEALELRMGAALPDRRWASAELQLVGTGEVDVQTCVGTLCSAARTVGQGRVWLSGSFDRIRLTGRTNSAIGIGGDGFGGPSQPRSAILRFE